MDYGLLIRDAWLTTWRHQFLWVLGLFAVTVGTLGVGGSALPVPSLEQLQALAPSLVQLEVAIAVIALVAAVVSAIARGGMTQATLTLESGEPISFWFALRAGRRLFWRFLLLLVLLSMVVGIIGGAVVLAAVNLGPVGAVLGALALSVGATLSVVLAYAERAIVALDVGPVAALRHGWRVFVEHLNASLLVWLLSVVLAVAAGSAVAMLASSLTILAGIVLLVASAAITNAFFWNYWTLAYVRLASPASTA
jgi:hypothetical protein